MSRPVAQSAEFQRAGRVGAIRETVRRWQISDPAAPPAAYCRCLMWSADFLNETEGFLD